MKLLKLLCLVLPLTLIAAGFKSELEKVNELNKSLLQAAAKGDIAQVKSLLSKGIDVNTKDDSGNTALHHAAGKGHKELVDFLINRGADVNVRDKDGFIPLHHAASEGCKSVVELLVAKGANVNARDQWGWTPLDGAAHAGHKDVAETLISAGADVNSRYGWGETPLMWATGAGHTDVVELLLNKGADVNAKDDQGRTPLHFAARYRPAMVELLIANGADVNVVTDAGTPLHYAAEVGNEKAVEVLISQGADVDVEDAYGRTSLHCSAVKGHKNIVEFLLAKGARIDSRDSAGRTPLHYAAGAGHLYGVKGGHAGIVQSLLDKGADINARDKWGWTPLHYATRMRHKPIVELLVSGGADLNATSERGDTAFSLAQRMPFMYKGHPAESEIVKQFSEIADFLRKDGCIYYLATGGKDSNPGTLHHPFRTLVAAIDIVEPGDIIFAQGGIYSYSSTIHIDKSGEQGKPIRLRAYPGENPIFDFSTAKGDGFLVTGAYWHIGGLAVTNAQRWGIRLETEGAHHNILEQITAYSNGLAGIALLNGSEYNLVLNCDSYRNFDPETNGEDADGFNGGRGIGESNIFIGCRAWNNADDGYDFGFTPIGVRLENCYACRNGENIWSHPCFTGNAVGFKAKGQEAEYVLIRCAAWDHRAGGFVRSTRSATTLYNCTALRNWPNYAFRGTYGTEKNVWRNNLSYKGGIEVKPEVDDQFNSWNTPPSLEMTDADFLSLDDRVIMGSRNPDGSLPESNFLRLAPGSDAIDAGTDVGLPFAGKAPDLGAFEYNPAAEDQSYVKMLHQVVRDHDLEKIRKILTEGTDVNEKDWLGYAPLHWAIYFGYPDTAEILISEGANPNVLSDTGRTTLEIAIEMGYERMADILREHGAKE